MNVGRDVGDDRLRRRLLGGEVDPAGLDLDAVALSVDAVARTLLSSMSTAITGENPSVAAAIERTPEPQP